MELKPKISECSGIEPPVLIVPFMELKLLHHRVKPGRPRVLIVPFMELKPWRKDTANCGYSVLIVPFMELKRAHKTQYRRPSVS